MRFNLSIGTSTMASIFSARSTFNLDEQQLTTSVSVSLEDKIVRAFDELTSKTSKSRLRACEEIQRSLRENHLREPIHSQKLTILETLTRCLKRRRADELCQVATIASLVCVSIGSETVETFSEVAAQISRIMIDDTMPTSTRIDCARSLSTCAFIISYSNLCIETMHKLYSIFKASAPKGDKKMPMIDKTTSSLHCVSLNGWLLLLVSLKEHKEQLRLAKECQDKIVELLDSSHLEIRQMAGESLAVICELIGNYNVMNFKEYEKLR